MKVVGFRPRTIIVDGVCAIALGVSEPDECRRADEAEERVKRNPGDDAAFEHEIAEEPRAQHHHGYEEPDHRPAFPADRRHAIAPSARAREPVFLFGHPTLPSRLT